MSRWDLDYPVWICESRPIDGRTLKSAGVISKITDGFVQATTVRGVPKHRIFDHRGESRTFQWMRTPDVWLEARDTE